MVHQFSICQAHGKFVYMGKRLSIVRIPPKRAVHPKVETFSRALVLHSIARLKITILTPTTKKKEDR